MGARAPATARILFRESTSRMEPPLQASRPRPNGWDSRKSRSSAPPASDVYRVRYCDSYTTCLCCTSAGEADIAEEERWTTSSPNSSARSHRALASTSTVGKKRATRGAGARAAHSFPRLPVPTLRLLRRDPSPGRSRDAIDPVGAFLLRRTHRIHITRSGGRSCGTLVRNAPKL